MPVLFEQTRIQGLSLPNRFIRAATWEGLAHEDGSGSPALLDLLVRLAGEGVGLIVTGHAFVSRDGRASPGQLGACSDRLVRPLGEMAEAVHREGGRIVMQLAHGGLQSKPELTGSPPRGPSSAEGLAGPGGEAMTVEMIRDTVEAFARAARRAKSAGFDGIQIHAAHGYLLSQFLSPAFNRREDAYGGSLANRARMLLEVITQVREEVGRYYPLLVKINCQDFLENGLDLGDVLRLAVRLEKARVDALEISGGTAFSGRYLPFRQAIRYERDQAYFRKAARALRGRIRIPVILVGGIRSYFQAERLVAEGWADYISLSRPLIREPDLVSRWRSGDLRKATCISCNGCLAAAMKSEGVYCVQDRKSEGQED